MRTNTHPAWIILILTILSLTITACVRPYPGSEASASQPTQVPLATQPVIVPEQPVVTPDIELPTAESPDLIEPTPAPVEPTAVPQAEQTHIVAAGDTLFKIALEYDVTVDEIAAANGIVDIDSLEVGQELIIPAPGSETATAVEETDESTGEESTSETDSATEASPTDVPAAADGVHIVQPGENLFRISLRYGCSVEQVAQFNGIATPNRISVGQEIQIPDCN